MDNWKEKVELNKEQGKKLFSSCGKCARRTRHTVMVSVDVDASNETYPFRMGDKISYAEVWTLDSYQIVRCGGCDSITFRHSSYFSEDTELGSAPDAYDAYAMAEVPVERIYVYPRRMIRREIDEVHLLPSVVRSIYHETRSSLANEEKILGGMGIRALVESVAKDKQAAGRNLKEKIEWLVSERLLTIAQGEFLQILRDMGNESAHDGKVHSEEDLLVALDIVEHLLVDAYILPSKARNLPSKLSP